MKLMGSRMPTGSNLEILRPIGSRKLMGLKKPKDSNLVILKVIMKLMGSSSGKRKLMG
jgi:hypothetical protein